MHVQHTCHHICQLQVLVSMQRQRVPWLNVQQAPGDSKTATAAEEYWWLCCLRPMVDRPGRQPDLWQDMHVPTRGFAGTVRENYRYKCLNKRYGVLCACDRNPLCCLYRTSNCRILFSRISCSATFDRLEKRLLAFITSQDTIQP